jgi:hypothetical protein
MRNQWLKDLTQKLRPIFKETRYTLVKIELETGTEGQVASSFEAGQQRIFIPASINTASKVMEFVARELADIVGGVLKTNEAGELDPTIGVDSITHGTDLAPRLETALAELGPYPEA